MAGRVLLVGDAAGYVDALTGEGIAVALACARALLGCVASSLLWARRQPLLAQRIVPLGRPAAAGVRHGRAAAGALR